MTPTVAGQATEIVYPESDGKPMSDNMTQARWITLIYENLEALFAADPNVLVAADNLIYPVQGNNELRQAPDVYVVFGRPKGDRGFYLYWNEDDIPVTVAFEILSPSNGAFEKADKLEFYNEHGIEEYYVYDPDTNRLRIYTRKNVLLIRERQVDGFISPRMGIRFDLSGEELVIRHPDGRPFVRLMQDRRRADAAEQQLEQTAEQLKQTNERLEQTNERLEQTNERLEQTNERLEQTNERLARLIELGRKARQGQATAEDLAELESLERGG